MGVNFRIVLDQPAARAGNTMQGFVVMSVEDDKVKGAKLNVTFRGAEKTCVRYTTTEGSGDNRRTVTRYAHSNRSLIHVELPTDELSFLQGGRIPKGKYQIPFQLRLPASLPESMSLVKGSEYCKIGYEFKVILKGSGVLWNYNAQVEVPILARYEPIDDPLPYSAPPVDERVNFLCCFNRGSVTLGSRMDDTKVVKGQTCKVSVSCRNHSSVEVSAVRAQLCQKVVWRASHHYSSTKQVLKSLNFTKSLLLQGSLARQNKQQQESVNSDFELADILADMQKGRHADTFTVPSTENIYLTYSSSLITVSHYVVIQMEMGGRCVGDPSVKIPLRIGTKPEATPTSGAMALNSTGPYVPPAYEDAESSPVIDVPSNSIHTGGPFVDGEEEETEIAIGPFPSDNNNQQHRPPSFDNLLQEMAESVADWDIIDCKLHDGEWNTTFAEMKPSQFAKLIEQVDLDFDQPKVAEAVGQKINNVTGQFTCEYVVAALRRTQEWNRATLVEKLIPYVSDLKENHTTILKAMTDWERLVTERAFGKALNDD